jgi:hypothetical protein
MASHIALDCILNFNKLNELLEGYIKDIEVNEQMTLRRIRMGGEGELLIIHADVIGVYAGAVKITCIPVWEKDLQKICLDNLGIKLESKNIFAKGANLIANTFMAKIIDKKFEEVLNTHVSRMLEFLVEKAAHFELPIGGMLKADSLELDIQDIHSTEDALQLRMLVDGNTSFVL